MKTAKEILRSKEFTDSDGQTGWTEEQVIIAMEEYSRQNNAELIRQKEFLTFALKHESVKAQGYAGILPNGNLVDRREFPHAIPLQENSLLNIPKPKPLPTPSAAAGNGA
jgi:hypothetical protein